MPMTEALLECGKPKTFPRDPACPWFYRWGEQEAETQSLANW